MATLIDGKAIAKLIESETLDDISRLRNAHGIAPGLAVVLVGNDPASKVYVGMKGKTSLRLGMTSVTETRPADVEENELLALVTQLNHEPTIHGILVQLPLPKHIDTHKIIDTIDPKKDVDGLHPQNIGLLCAGRPRFIPCTPYGVVELLIRSKVSPRGKEVVVLGRSNLVGRPVANLLSSKTKYGDATVTVCHSRSSSLPEICRRADILISAIGQKKYVTADYIKPGAVVIDVGIHRLSEEEGGGLCGDVDFQSVAEVASMITPVPGGVGPMTIAMLMRNTVDAALRSVSGF
jgi:methylenetetrahydrofolate dehydrogenase (NADP+)/methenyltetrahydrofolate cyclohydrolase